MSRIKSLLAGRNSSRLSQTDKVRAINTFMGLDRTVNVRYEDNENTAFHVAYDEFGNEYGEIVCGPDIYPGSSVVDPNSSLGLQAAAAHELTHYYRWKDKIQLPEGSLEYLDEALTSLQAVHRYGKELSEQDVRQLVSDAAQRVQLYIQNQRPE